ncbi:invasin domain 3-containing protein, partial [Desulfobacterales bacterium HSG17]|nr:invasin domain 3-containing protein [Desulfobacterales bacterium HSG17]
PAKDVDDATGQDIVIRANARDNVVGTMTITLKEGTITLVPEIVTLVADGVSSNTLVATVKDFEGKTTPDGETILFIASDGTFGNLSTTSGSTSGGIVSVEYTSSKTPGDITIDASGFGYKASNTLSWTLTAQGLGSLLISPKDPSLSADGVSSTVLTVSATSDTGGPMVKGTEVNLETNNGVFLNGQKATTVKLSDDGSIQVPFKSELLDTGVIATITATITIGTDVLTQKAVIELIGLPTITGLTLTANNESIPADGVSISVITATVTPANGEEPPDGISVVFNIKVGNASWATSAQKEISSSTTDGIAFASLNSSKTPGIIIIRAEAGEFNDEIEIEFTPGGISLEVSRNAVLGTGLETVNVTATLTDQTGVLANNETVVFSLVDQKYGKFSVNNVTTNAEGVATTIFEAGTIGGTATITATWEGTTVSSSIDITIQSPPAFISVAEGFPTPTAINGAL